LAQGRQVDGDDVDAVEEVLPELPWAIRSSNSWLVAAMIRTSTGSSALPPTLRTVFSWSARSSLTCIEGVISPISSRNRVPRSASWKSPFFSRTAPVKPPLVAEELALQKVSGSAPQ